MGFFLNLSAAEKMVLKILNIASSLPGLSGTKRENHLKKRRVPVIIKKRSYQKLLGISIFVLLTCLFLFSGGPESPAGGLFEMARTDEDILCEWSGVKRIVAVGDLHGAYEYFRDILIGTGLIDPDNRWIGGQTHLVQIGDVMDRGDEAKAIFDLIRILEKEAEEAGGYVHLLIGNHEEMNLGDIALDREGYVSAGQFRDFLPEKYVLSQEKRFSRRAGIYPSENDPEKPDFTEFWDTIIAKADGNSNYSPRKLYYKNFVDEYGRWLLGKNVVIKINDIVFVHGGISEFFSKRGLREINDRYRLEMDDLISAILTGLSPNIPEYDREILFYPEGPLWYRDLALPMTSEFEDDVIRILNNLEAEHIVVAHTPTTAVGKENMSRYGGRVWIIDTGIADYYRSIGGHVSALVIEDGVFDVWYPPDKTVSVRGEEEKAPSSSESFFFRLHLMFPHLKVGFLQPYQRRGKCM